MPTSILSKGYTFGSTEQVTSTKLGNLVDLATFTSAATDGVTTELSGGAIIVRNGGITPTKLSTKAPTWDGISGDLTVASGGNFICGGTGTFGGTISTSGGLAVNGASTLTGDVTCASQIIRSGTASNRTVPLRTGATSPNAISFGFNDGDLLVTIDTTEYKITMTQVT